MPYPHVSGGPSHFLLAEGAFLDLISFGGLVRPGGIVVDDYRLPAVDRPFDHIVEF